MQIMTALRSSTNVEAHVGFGSQTGSYLLKDGHEYKVARQFQHSQARKAELKLYSRKITKEQGIKECEGCRTAFTSFY